MSKEEFLLDMLEYYAVDPEGRRCRGEGMCFYSPETANKPTSEGCAVGRKLDRSVANAIDKKYPCGLGIRDIMDERFEGIPDYMYDLGYKFIGDCQNLHDVSENWDFTKMSLSLIGQIEVETLIKDYNLDKSKFEKYL